MNPILPTEEARAECLKLIEELDSNPLGYALMAPGHGRMFGVLVCTDGTVLRAFSGELEGELLAEGFVTPLFDVASYRAILYKYDRLIKSSQDHRNLSRKCWEELKELYRLTCFDGSVLKLTSVLPNSPSGTGDCCAPRLLSHAYSLGKKPSSLCEFFYGSGTMEHKSFQNPCDSRCRPLLPFIIGLDIIYQDRDIVVVNKPSGMLSIEGDFRLFLLDGVKDAWDAMPDILLQNELAETDGEHDADGGKHEIQDVGMLKMNAQ